MRSTRNNLKHLAFGPLLSLVFLLWVAYRFLFHFPVWFDELFGKAVFFGLPVWLYATMSREKNVRQTFEVSRLQPGLVLGILMGGIYGFAATIASFLKRGVIIQAAPLFLSDVFWWNFFLAFMTGFWESLFFYSFVMTIIRIKYNRLPLIQHILLTSAVFVLFHLPNTFLRFSMTEVIGQVFLLWCFSLGQAFIFARSKNVYALAMSHAIWGMVLLIHGG